MNRWSTLLMAAALVVPAAAQAQKPSNNMHTRSADAYLVQAEREAVLADKREFLVKALEAALEGTKSDPENPRSWFQAGQAYFGMKDWAGADSAFDRAERLYPEYARDIDPIRQAAWVEAYNTAVSALQANQVAEAKAALQLADQLYRKRPEAMVTLGSLHIQEGELDEGIAVFKAALELLRGPERAKLTPEKETAWAEDETNVSLRLANVYMEQEKFAEAEQVYRSLLESQPDNMMARTNLAVAMSRAGKTAEAAAAYRDLLAAEGLSEATLFNIGIGLFRAQDFDQAAQAFSKALELNPYSHESLYNYGQSLFGRIGKLETELASAPAAGRQEIQAELLKLNEAMRATSEQLLALDPTNRNAMMMLAQAQRSLSELDTAGKDRWQRAALATLEKHKALPFEVGDINTVPSQGSVQVLGKVTNLTAPAGTPLAFRFSVIDASGTELAGEDISIPAPATGESTRFDTTFSVPETAVSWKYVVK